MKPILGSAANHPGSSQKVHRPVQAVELCYVVGGASYELLHEDRRIVDALEPRISNKILPQYDAVVNRRQYNSTLEPDGVERSSTGYATDLGTAQTAGFAAGEIYFGYLARNYDATLARPIAAVNFGGIFEWHPNAVISLRFNLGRGVEEWAMLGSRRSLQIAVLRRSGRL